VEVGRGSIEEEPSVLDRNHAPGWPATRHGDLGAVAGWQALLQYGKDIAKARNLAANPNCIMCTDDAAEAVILEGVIATERNIKTIREFLPLYEKKYKFDMSGMADDLLKLKEPVFYLRPKVTFGLWEKKFSTSATRWLF